jgi:hypothetical protein
MLAPFFHGRLSVVKYLITFAQLRAQLIDIRPDLLFAISEFSYRVIGRHQVLFINTMS